MVSLLLIISFLLHIVLLLAIYFMYQQLVQIKNHKNEELVSVIQEFIDEMKVENERLKKQLQNKEPRREVEPIAMDEKADDRIKTITKREKIYQTSTPQIPIEQKEDKLETSYEAQIFQMANQGMSADQIAQKLNRGKTEVELMIKLHRKE